MSQDSPNLRGVAATPAGTMTLSQVQYLNTARDGEFSLRTWALKADLRDPQRLDQLWTQNAMEHLNKSRTERGSRIIRRSSQLSQADRMSIIKKAVEDNEHQDAMRPTVNTHLRHLANRVNEDLAQDCVDAKRAAARLDDDKKVQSNHPAKSKRKMPQEGSPRESKKQTRSTGEAPVSNETTPITDINQDTFSCSRLYFNIDDARHATLVVSGFNVGQAFRALQERASPLVNNDALKISSKDLHLMMSANHIWDTSECLPGMAKDIHRAILTEIKPAIVRLRVEHTHLCLDLSNELATGGRIRSRAMNSEKEEDILQLFQDLSKKLPSVAAPYVAINEDTFSHGALDALMTFIFPSSDSGLQLSWADRPAPGSRERRGVNQANKPDCTLTKEQFDVAYAEVKAPKDVSKTRLFIEDKWALTSLAKDAIDLHLREQRRITSIYCMQVFGHQLSIYELRFQSGLYLWIELGTGYLPRDKNDTYGIIRCMELLGTLKGLLNSVNLSPYIHTPRKRLPDHLLPEEYRPQPTNITPSTRHFFGCVKAPKTNQNERD